MAEYIEREAAIDAVLDVFYDTTDIDLSGEKLEAAILNVQAADVEPVVRCRDCKYRIYVDMGDEIGAVGGCELFGVAMHYNCFCSYGERKEGDD